MHGIQDEKKNKYHTNRDTTNRDWQLTIKLAGYRNRRTKRCGYAYEAKDIAETTIFVGCRSIGARTHLMAIQEAMVKALFKAKELGFQSIIVLTGSKEQAKIVNLHYLRQQGVIFNIKAASKLILSRVFDKALFASKMHVHLCWVHPAFLQCLT